MKLVAQTNAVVPGHRLWAGLEFRIDPGWHIYWMNPGDSGEPPTITWRLPNGFRVGQMEWPAPERLGQGSIVDYGYRNQVLLLVPLSTPAKIANPKIRLAAQIEWLVCSDICVPAQASVTLDLPVAAHASVLPAMRELFANARFQLPRAAPQRWRASAIDAGADFVLTILTGRREPTASFFPLAPDQIRNAAPQPVHPIFGGVRLTLHKSDLLIKPVQVLRGLVRFNAGPAYVVAAPVSHRMKR